MKKYFCLFIITIAMSAYCMESPKTDTINDSSTLIDSSNAIEQKLNLFEKHITEINEHTNAFSGMALAITIITVLASLVTIGGFIGICIELKKRDTSKEWQRRIALDLIRHFMVNNAIIEVIRTQMHKQPSCHPLEGVLCRFATLDSDTDLARFSINEDNYEKIHNLSLKIRNYNHVVVLADKHLCDPNYQAKDKEGELENIVIRSIEINKRLIEFCKTLKKDITKEIIHQYIVNERYNAKTVGKWKREKKYDDNFLILPRTSSIHEYYDKELGLTQAFNQQIKRQAALIQFVNY